MIEINPGEVTAWPHLGFSISDRDNGRKTHHHDWGIVEYFVCPSGFFTHCVLRDRVVSYPGYL